VALIDPDRIRKIAEEGASGNGSLIDANRISKLSPSTSPEQNKPSFQDIMSGLGKTLSRSGIRNIAEILPRIGQLIGTELQARPEAAKKHIEGLTGRPEQLQPFPKLLTQIGRKLGATSDQAILDIEEAVKGIEGIQPSERILKQRREGFTRQNFAERSLQLGAEGLPSLVTALGVSIVTRNPIAGAAVLGISEAGQLQQESKEAGADIITQANIGLTAAIGNTLLESIPITHMLRGTSLGRKAIAKALKRKGAIEMLKSTLKRVGGGVVGEGTQEAVQQVFSNLVAKIGFDEARDLLEGVLDSFVGGAITGGVAGGGISGYEAVINKAKKAGAAQQDIDKAHEALGTVVAGNSAEISAKIQQTIREDQRKADEAIEVTDIERNTELTEDEQEQKFKDVDDIPLTIQDLARQALREVAVTPKKELIEGQPKSQIKREIEKVTGIKTERKSITVEEKTALRHLFRRQAQVTKQLDKVKNVEKREALKEQRNKIQETMRLRKGIRRLPIEKMNVEEKVAINEIKKELKNSTNLERLRDAYNKILTLKEIGQEKFIFTQESRNEFLDAEIEAMTKQIPVKKETKEVNVGMSLKERNVGKKAFFSALRPSRIIDRFVDGFQNFKGNAHRFFIDTVNSQRDREIVQVEKAKEIGLKILEEAGLTSGKLAEQIQVRDGGKLFNFSRSAAMHMWAVRTNKENIAAILFGNKINSKVYRQVMAQLSQVEKDAADKMTKELSSHFSRLRETYLEINDGTKDLAKVEGGYVPMIRENDTSQTYEEELANEFAQRTAYRRAFVARQFTKKRQKISSEHQKPILLGLSEVYFSHIQKREHFINLAPHVRDMKKVINDEKFVGSMKDSTGGMEALDEIKSYVDAVADPRIFKSNKWHNRFIQMARKKSAIVFLGFNLVTMMKQLPSYVLAMNEMPVQDITAGTYDYVTDFKNMNKFIHEKAPQLMKRSVNVEIDEYKKIDPKRFDKAKSKYGLASMKGILLFDQVVTHSLWLGKYNQMKRAGFSENESVKEATNVVLRTQPAAEAKDLPSLFRDENLGMFTQFQNQLNQIFNIVTNDIPLRLRDKDTRGQALRGMFALILNWYLIWSISNGRLPQDEEDFKDILIEPFNMVPLAGHIMSGGLRGFSASLPPALQIAVSGIDTVKAFKQGELDKVLENSVEFMALLHGIPATQPIRTLRGIIDLSTGDTEDLRRLIYSKSVIERGTEKSKHKRKKKVKRNTQKLKRQFDDALDFLGL